MTVLTLTPNESRASVDVVVTDAPATVSLYRTDSSGRVVLLRGSPFHTQAGAATVVDQEAPFGLLTYATSPAGADAATTTLPSDVPWLTHPMGPFLSLPVTVVDDDSWTLPGRTFVFDVIDRGEPVVTWYRRSTRAGVLRLAYSTLAERRNIADALAAGVPLLIRYPPGCAAFLTGYVAVFDARLTPLTPGSSSGVIELDYVVVAMPPGDLLATPGWSWADVPGAFPTWSDLHTSLGSWAAVVVHAPGGTPAAATAPDVRFGA